MSDPFLVQRIHMVRTQIEARNIVDPLVLQSMREVPRHFFVPDSIIHEAYQDNPLPISNGQTISQPYIVALMAEAARVIPGDNVLEIGAGCGYAAAVLSRIATKVVTIEIIPELSDFAQRNLAKAGIDNVEVVTSDGSVGYPQAAPFDVIIVTAAAPTLPPSLVAQLNINGRLIIPVRKDAFSERLMRVTKLSPDEIQEEYLEAVRFVPLRGKEGFN